MKKILQRSSTKVGKIENWLIWVTNLKCTQQDPEIKVNWCATNMFLLAIFKGSKVTYYVTHILMFYHYLNLSPGLICRTLLHCGYFSGYLNKYMICVQVMYFSGSIHFMYSKIYYGTWCMCVFGGQVFSLQFVCQLHIQSTVFASTQCITLAPGLTSWLTKWMRQGRWKCAMFCSQA